MNSSIFIYMWWTCDCGAIPIPTLPLFQLQLKSVGLQVLSETPFPKSPIQKLKLPSKPNLKLRLPLLFLDTYY